MSVLIDSDILIEVSRGRDEILISRWPELSDSETVVLCSPVTIAEVWAEARPSEYRIIESLFDALACVPVDEQTARHAAGYLRKYRKSHSVEFADVLVAAAASLNRADL